MTPTQSKVPCTYKLPLNQALLENVSERRIYIFVARRTWDVGAPEVGR